MLCSFSPIEDAEWQWQLDDCGPEPDPLCYVQAGLAGVDDIDNPEGDVHHKEEAHNLPSRLSSQLPGGVNEPE